MWQIKVNLGFYFCIVLARLMHFGESFRSVGSFCEMTEKLKMLCNAVLEQIHSKPWLHHNIIAALSEQRARRSMRSNALMHDAFHSWRLFCKPVPHTNASRKHKSSIMHHWRPLDISHGRRRADGVQTIERAGSDWVTDTITKDVLWEINRCILMMRVFEWQLTSDTDWWERMQTS